MKVSDCLDKGLITSAIGVGHTTNLLGFDAPLMHRTCKLTRLDEAGL